MEFYAESIKYELQLRTNMRQCQYMGSGRFEFNLDYVEFRNEHKFQVALKNLEVPKLRKKMRFECYIGKFYEAFIKDKMMKTFDIEFESYEELADLLDIKLNQTFTLNANICLNFESSHDKHVCDSSETLRNAKKVSVVYRNDRFFLYITSNVVVYMSHELALCLGLHSELDGRDVNEVTGGYVCLKKPCYVSSKKTFFLHKTESRINVVLHDSISQQVVLTSGESWPILFSGCVKGDSVGEMDKIMCIKKMTTRSNNQFCIGFYDGNMEPFRCNNDLAENPFSFTLVFLLR